MDFVSKIVSGNIDRIKRNISNSFVHDLDVEKGFDDELEKGKWNVGDQRFYHGTMHYVAELKPDGSPRWKRVKKTSGGSNGSSAASSAPSQNNIPTSSAQKNSNDVKKLNIDIDSDKIGSLLATFYKYGTKEDYQTKLQALQVLIDPSSNKEFWDHAFKVAQEKINKKDDGQSNNNAVKQPTFAVNNSASKQTQNSSSTQTPTSSKTDSSTQNNSVKNDSKSNATNNTSVKNNPTSNKKDKFVDKVMSVIDEFGSYYKFSEFSKEKVEKIISDNISESKEFLSFKFPSGVSVSQGFYHNADKKTYNLQGSDVTFEIDKTYNTTSRYAGHLGTITTHYYIYYKGKRIAFSSSSTGSKWGSSPSEAKKECLYSGLIKYLSEKYNQDVSK